MGIVDSQVKIVDSQGENSPSPTPGVGWGIKDLRARETLLNMAVKIICLPAGKGLF